MKLHRLQVRLEGAEVSSGQWRSGHSVSERRPAPQMLRPPWALERPPYRIRQRRRPDWMELRQPEAPRFKQQPDLVQFSSRSFVRTRTLLNIESEAMRRLRLHASPSLMMNIAVV